jgi:hypothetical protein
MYGGTNEFYSSNKLPINDWSDSIYGYPGSNNTYYELHPKLKNDDSFVGAAGSFNKVVLPKTMALFEIKTNNAIWNEFSKSSNLVGLTISSKDASVNTVNIVNVQRISFTDTSLALDIGANQTAGSSYMLYKAAFNRTPDVSGLGYWISKMDTGMSYNDVAKNFVTSTEFKTAFGGSNPSVNTLVTKLYNNVLNRTPDAGGLTFWQDKLNTGWSTADVLGFFSTSGENVTNVTPLIANGISYTQFVG